MQLRLLSRASALAVLQATLVERALTARWPDVTVERLTRSSTGDRDPQIDLWAAADKGLFTSDLSQALARRRAPTLVVHSWKDLPTSGHPGTVVAATLERADPRDVLLVRRAVVSGAPIHAQRPVVFASSRLADSGIRAASAALACHRRSRRAGPRQRADAADQARERRRRRLDRGEGGARPAALQRLAGRDRRGSASGAREMPVDGPADSKEHPTAPAQGALAVEIAAGRPDLLDRVRAISHRADVGGRRTRAEHSRIVRRRLP